MLKAKTKRKLRNRSTKAKRFFIFFLILGVISVGAGYLIAAKPFEQTKHVQQTSRRISINEKQKQDKTIADIKKALTKEQIEVQSIEAVNEGYLITLDKGKTVLFSAKKDIQSQISSLQFILSRLTMEGRQFSRLDLRFDKPIIVGK
jgi:hypothetical protein